MFKTPHSDEALGVRRWATPRPGQAKRQWRFGPLWPGGNNSHGPPPKTCLPQPTRTYLTSYLAHPNLTPLKKKGQRKIAAVFGVMSIWAMCLSLASVGLRHWNRVPMSQSTSFRNWAPSIDMPQGLRAQKFPNKKPKWLRLPANHPAESRWCWISFMVSTGRIVGSESHRRVLWKASAYMTKNKQSPSKDGPNGQGYFPYPRGSPIWLLPLM